MEDSFIKTYRKLLKWEWADNPYMMALWWRLLLTANYTDTRWHGMVIERGKLVTSVAKLSEESGLSVKQVRMCLERLIDTKEIVTKTTNKYTIITICKYDDYQAYDTSEGQTKDKQKTNKGQTTKEISPTPPIRNIEEIKEEKEYIPPIVPPYADGKKSFGIFLNVFLSDSDIEKIRMQISYRGLNPDKYFQRVVDKYSAYKRQTGKNYRDDAAACINFGIASVLEEEQRTAPRGMQQQKSKSERLDEAFEKTKELLGLNDED